MLTNDEIVCRISVSESYTSERIASKQIGEKPAYLRDAGEMVGSGFSHSIPPDFSLENGSGQYTSFFPAVFA